MGYKEIEYPVGSGTAIAQQSNGKITSKQEGH